VSSAGARRRPALLLLVAPAVAAAVALSAWFAAGHESAAEKRAFAATRSEPLRLFSSLPLYWGEARDIGAMLNGKAPRHWARAAIEQQRPLQPIDTLDARTLAGAHDLLIAQPRPLSPEENVALDQWVARGGRVLLFADPALTAHSAFAVGDKRRPQDVVLLSPILGRWGLALEFDEEQALGERTVAIDRGASLTVNLPGRFAKSSAGRGDAACRLSREAVIAQCTVGRGRVVAVADAALFEDATDSDLGARRRALTELLERAFPA